MNSQATQPRAPVIDTNAIMEITDGVWVIPDSDHTPLMPNIGIVVGARATLVIDTGFGPDNARAVLEQARSLSDGRPVFLTHTHCHPEHGFGANVVAGKVTIVYNDAQWSELQHKGPILLQMFRKNFAALAPMLDGVEFVAPHLRYTGSLNVDLGGGHIVELHEFGGAHSLGDQGILVRGPASVLFTGDLVEEGTFGVLGDSDSHTVPWLDRVSRFEQLNPDLVVPGHGLPGGPERIADYRAYLELATRRVNELRAADELSEAEIADRVSAEVLGLHPDWQNQIWARKAVEDLTWPARPLPATRAGAETIGTEVNACPSRVQVIKASREPGLGRPARASGVPGRPGSPVQRYWPASGAGFLPLTAADRAKAAAHAKLFAGVPGGAEKPDRRSDPGGGQQGDRDPHPGQPGQQGL